MKSICVFILFAAIVQAIACIECEAGSAMRDLTPLLTGEGQGSSGKSAISHITLRAHEKAYVKCPVHESVGIDCQYEISDDKVLALIDSKVKYDSPWRMISGMTGADSAQMTLIFKANKTGAVILKIHEIFRGKLKETKSIGITVSTAPEKASIGSATMEQDGTIVLQLRAEGPKGTIGDALVRYPPNHPEYNKIRQHLGGLKKGEVKPVPPWPEQ
jgi:hypothetical protein